MARRAFDGRDRLTDHERRTLRRISVRQANPRSRAILRRHRARYRASHLRRMWTQGVGRFNRVYPEHSLSQARGKPFLDFTEVRRVFEAVGASPREAYIFATIARGESGGGQWGGYPGIRGDDRNRIRSKGWGLVQCTPMVWGPLALEHLARLGGVVALRNPLINAQMAYFLYQVAGSSFRDWRGTLYFDDPGPGVESALVAADIRWVRLGGLGRLRTR